MDKSFLLLFFKKEVLAFLLLSVSVSGGWNYSRKEASASFLKKRSKKLLFHDIPPLDAMSDVASQASWPWGKRFLHLLFKTTCFLAADFCAPSLRFHGKAVLA